MLNIIIMSVVLWLFFIAVATVKNKLFNEDLNIVFKIPMYSLGAVFVVFDVIFNYTYGAVIYWEFASNERKTLTARLKHILHSGDYAEDEWRFKLALFMCKYMISPFDFNHCGLGLGE